MRETNRFGIGLPVGLGLFLLLALAPAPLTAAPSPPDTWEGVERVVAVGDVHGDYAALLAVLKDAALVDGGGRWTGGRTHLVQTGDRIDRGPHSRKVMDFLMRLEKEARKAGGAVHALVGNHEAMNVLGDLRYVTPEDFAAFRTSDSPRLRDAYFADLVAKRRERKQAPFTPEERREWEAAHPPGFVEHRLAFARAGAYGAWISGQNAIIRLGDTLFVHGGISPKYADLPLTEINDRIRQELREGDHALALMSRDPEGPLWFRGLAQDDPALETHVGDLLRRHGARRLVIGHTPTDGLVMPRYGGRVLQIDVGLSGVFGGPPAALLIEGGRATALHRGGRVALPEDGGDVLRYVREIAALEPGNPRLARLVASLAGALTTAPAP